MSTEEAPRGLIGRVRANPRFAAFVGLGLLLIGLAITGVFGIDRATDITSDEAIEIARPEIDFVPVNEGARFLRQGASLRPIWAVSFSIPGENGRDFERLTTVEVDARSGEIIRISIDDPAD